MTLGRIGLYLGILTASVALSGLLLTARSRHGRSPRTPRDPLEPRRPGVAAASGPGPVESAGRPAPAPRQQPDDVGEDPLTDALCPPGMLLADGTACAESARACAEPDPKVPGSCRRYEPARCRRGMSLRFCIDRYEYPNVEGMLPAVMITFNQAQSGCEEEGKRLCTETEWAFACEGPRGLAYSRGDARDDSACNVGHAIENARPEALWEASGVAAVVERLDARTRSGAMRDCASAFGARDLIGNVEEWVKSDTPGFEGALRGGEYSAEPTCRTTRQIRQAGFRQLHTGFRCCEDPLVRAARRRR